MVRRTRRSTGKALEATPPGFDDQDFSSGLEIYTEDSLYWKPAWRENNTLNQNPDRELSLIYSRGKDNLRDRLGRLSSGLSPVSKVLLRVVHLVSVIGISTTARRHSSVTSSTM